MSPGVPLVAFVLILSGSLLGKEVKAEQIRQPVHGITAAGIECHEVSAGRGNLTANNCSIFLQPNTDPPETFTLQLRNIGYALERIKFGTFRQLPNRDKISDVIIETQVEALGDHAFADISGIKRMDLSHNLISNISASAFAGLRNLTVLKLRSNNDLLAEIPNGTFDGLEVLRELYLGENELMEIPTPLPPTLKTLDLTTNRIAAVDLPSDMNVVLPRPVQVDLCKNDFKSFQNPPFSVVDLENLCIGSNVSTISPGLLRSMQKLEKLAINAEKASTAPLLRTEVLEAISSLPKLQSLRIHNFALSNFSSFAQMTSLTVLSLSRIPNAEFVNLEALVEMKKLRSLSLKQSHLLASTLLSSGKMRTLLGRLGELYLPSTNITRLPDDPEKLFGGLSELDISGNYHLECDCTVAWVKKKQDLRQINLKSPRKTWCFNSTADSVMLLEENEVTCLQPASPTPAVPSSSTPFAPRSPEIPTMSAEEALGTQTTLTNGTDVFNATHPEGRNEEASHDYIYHIIVIGSLLGFITVISAAILIRRKIMKISGRRGLHGVTEPAKEEKDIPVLYSKLDTQDTEEGDTKSDNAHAQTCPPEM